MLAEGRNVERPFETNWCAAQTACWLVRAGKTLNNSCCCILCPNPNLSSPHRPSIPQPLHFSVDPTCNPAYNSAACAAGLGRTLAKRVWRAGRHWRRCEANSRCGMNRWGQRDRASTQEHLHLLSAPDPAPLLTLLRHVVRFLDFFASAPDQYLA